MSSEALPPLAQVCAVAYRQGGSTERKSPIEFCLITSISKGRWGFPKGIVDPGETPQESALKEAQEEAGLSGRILGDELGSYEDFKWGRTLIVTGYLMQVTAAADAWLEATVRQREFVSAAEAARRIAHRGQQRFLAVALKRLRSAE